MMNNAAIRQTMENVKKTCNKRTKETCNKRKNKKVFGVRTKLSYYKDFHETCIGNRNEKNSNTYE